MFEDDPTAIIDTNSIAFKATATLGIDNHFSSGD
jgi:hypothetical protein